MESVLSHYHSLLHRAKEERTVPNGTTEVLIGHFQSCHMSLRLFVYCIIHNKLLIFFLLRAFGIGGREPAATWRDTTNW